MTYIQPYIKTIQNAYFEEYNSPEYFLIVDNKIFSTYFCLTCGEYQYKKDFVKKYTCNCDERKTCFTLYRNFFITFEEEYDGDDISDYLESPNEAHPYVIKFLYKAILFGITLESDINLDKRIEKYILEFL